VTSSPLSTRALAGALTLASVGGRCCGTLYTIGTSRRTEGMLVRGSLTAEDGSARDALLEMKKPFDLLVEGLDFVAE